MSCSRADEEQPLCRISDSVARVITIDMYADALCAWAYIGHRRLCLALERLDRPIRVRWRPFLIDPSAPRPSEPLAEVLADSGIQEELQRCTPAGTSRSDHGQEVRRLAAELGIGPEWSPRWRANSWGAQRLIAAAGAIGEQAQRAVADEVLHAHFVTGDDIARLDVLGPIADRYGLPHPPASEDGVSTPAYLEPGLYREDPAERSTREALLTGQAIGVRSSPTFAHGDHIVAVGAQPPDVLTDLFASLTPRTAPPPEVRRLRLAQALLDVNNPLGCLYLLEPLRPRHDGDRWLELLTARALLAAASLGAARDTLTQLLEQSPDDAELHLLMSQALRRSGDSRGAHYHLSRAGQTPDPTAPHPPQPSVIPPAIPRKPPSPGG